jgi:hypothetical protein
MTVVPDAFKKVPMMFQAQVDGRCQIQRLDPDKKKHGEIQDCDRWADEWIDKVDQELPASRSGVQTREWAFTWRVLSNSGADDSVIRPVIGARGYPYYPGSSMKGLFRRACTLEQAARYCGKPLPGNDWEPGLLRFHGGYPVNDDWTHHLVDIVHPQQGRQVKDQSEPSSAFVQVSLYQPRMRFEISSRVALMDEEWMRLQQVEPSSSRCADWRESWHPQRVQVWGREASDRDDSEAIRWFHGAYQPKTSRVQEEGSIYRSSIAGQMGQIGRIWHRMYPVVRLPPPKTPGEKPIPKPTSKFLELLTIFPDGSRESERFLRA